MKNWKNASVQKEIQVILVLLVLVLSFLSMSVAEGKKLEDGYITRDRMMEIAEGYMTHRWTPTDKNVFFHQDCEKCCSANCAYNRVDTPNKSNGGWWIHNKENIGIPYQWGGFSSISEFDFINTEDFDEQIKSIIPSNPDFNFHAGDIYCVPWESEDKWKGECTYACGVDCSGFVGRCWNLSKPKPSSTSLATREFSWPIKFENLREGDMLYTTGHVMLFKEFSNPERTLITVYEASAKDWKVSERDYTVGTLLKDRETGKKEGYGATLTNGSYTGDYWAYTYNPIKLGLIWLREHQNPSGSWRNDVGITSMSVLAFLNADYTEDDPTVNKAIQYVLDNRNNADGSFGGTYETSLAVLALVATHNASYNDEIADARDWLVDTQYDEGEGAVPTDACYGGWRYGSSPSDGDLSNTQFALMALSAAGLPSGSDTWTKAITFTTHCQNRPASNDQAWAHDNTQPSYDDGGFIYYPTGWSLAGGSKSYGSMTSAGIWSLRLCGVVVTDPEGRVQAGLNWLADNEDCSFDDNPGIPESRRFQYYYYMTTAKALAMCFSYMVWMKSILLTLVMIGILLFLPNY